MERATVKLVAVTGGRGFQNRELVFKTLYDELHRCQDEGLTMLLLHGGCWAGADAHAATWAHKTGIQSLVALPNWEVYGRKAGPIRNRYMMLMRPNVLYAFPGGRGTESCVAEASNLGILTIHVKEEVD